MRDTLICTVGTSLKNNLSREPGTAAYQRFAVENAKGVALELLNHPPEDRLNGAEINSIHSVIAGKHLERCENLVFLVSDTKDGAFTGQILKHFYENPRNRERFTSVGMKTVSGLTDEDAKRFRTDGLRNLVRLIGQETRLRGADRLLINATGGYKAQISFAGMIGQALDIPVCYLFERFSEVIQLPPQPVSLDLTFWLEYTELFFDLAEGMETEMKLQLPDERFATLVDEEPVDGRWITVLSPTGQLFHESLRYSFRRCAKNVLPPDSGIPPQKKKVRYEDDNKGKHKGLRGFLDNLLDQPYVKEIYTHYYNPRLSAPLRFRKSAKGLPGQVEGVFNNAGATTKFDIVTTATSSRQLLACIADLNHLFMNVT